MIFNLFDTIYVSGGVFVPYFTLFHDQLFSTSALSKGEREKIDNYLRILEESGIGQELFRKLI